MELYQDKEEDSNSNNGELGIGCQLKNKRNELGFSLDDAARITRIAKKYLVAIEEERFQELPGTTYTKGFLKTYCIYLKTDPKDVMDQYKRSINESTEPSFYVEPDKTQDSNPFIDLIKELDVKIVSIIFAAVFILYFLIKGIVVWQEKRIIEETIFKPQVASSKVALPSEAANIKRISAQKSETKVGLNIEAIETVWMRVYVDEKLVFEHTLKKGEKKDFNAQDNISVKIGDASAVRLIYNGKTIESLGSSGSVVNVKFDKNGRWISE